MPSDRGGWRQTAGSGSHTTCRPHHLPASHEGAHLSPAHAHLGTSPLARHPPDGPRETLPRPARGQAGTAARVMGSPERLERGWATREAPFPRVEPGLELSGRKRPGGADTSHRAGQLLGVGLALCPLEEACSRPGGMPRFPATSRRWPPGASVPRSLVWPAREARGMPAVTGSPHLPSSPQTSVHSCSGCTLRNTESGSHSSPWRVGWQLLVSF